MNSRDEESLLPPPPKVSGGERYTEREGRAPWSITEDLLLWPFLQKCGRLSLYGEACLWLTQSLFRPPVQPRHARWTEAEWKQEAISIIERRTITEVMSGCSNVKGRYAELLKTARTQYLGVHKDAPFTWAEEVRILWPFFRNVNQQPRIPIEELMVFLDRNDYDARRAEVWYARILAGGGNLDRERWSGGNLQIKLNEAKYLGAVTKYTKTDLASDEELRLNWWGIVNLVGA